MVLSSNRGGVYGWSNHALDRWRERFPGIDKDGDFASAARVGKKTKKKIKLISPKSSDKYLRDFKGRYALISRSKIVYIIGANNESGVYTIITVFHLYREISQGVGDGVSV